MTNYPMTKCGARCALVIGIWTLILFPAQATTFLTQQEALEKAFPGAEVTRRTVTLTDDQLKTAGKLAGSKIPSALVFVYEAARDGAVVGTAYFDVQRVHSLPQTLMLVVSRDGRLRSLDVLAFKEPPKFMAPAAWLEQFPGRALDDSLQLRQDIQGISGATLTARATTKSVRRVLAIHAVLQEGR
ncbi:MAG TPA: FMN-binding protein [Kiritimatiellia bacterium]|nr:FMN-binding protein [Kiritimatiellia bacterium]